MLTPKLAKHETCASGPERGPLNTDWCGSGRKKGSSTARYAIGAGRALCRVAQHLADLSDESGAASRVGVFERVLEIRGALAELRAIEHAR